LGHGTKDEKVAIEIGREAKRCLGLLGDDVQMAEYEGLWHWDSDEMLGDILDFLREKLCIEDAQHRSSPGSFGICIIEEQSGSGSSRSFVFENRGRHENKGDILTESFRNQSMRSRTKDKCLSPPQ
jgi:hypothetical protein